MSSIQLGRCRINTGALGEAQKQSIAPFFQEVETSIEDLNFPQPAPSTMPLTALIEGAIRLSCEFHKGYPYVHATTIQHGQRIAMIAGVSGSGKTTLGAALAKLEGWTFLSEDLTYLDPKELSIIPYCIPLSIRDNGWAMLQRLPGWSISHRDEDRWLRSTPDFQHIDRLHPNEIWLLEQEKQDNPLRITAQNSAAMLRKLLSTTNIIYNEERLTKFSATLDKANCQVLSGGTLPDRISAFKEQQPD